jgi:hypothetical protein
MKDDLLFNIDHGYAEGLCRGFKSGILRATDYHNLVQCETLEGKFSCQIIFNLLVCRFETSSSID